MSIQIGCLVLILVTWVLSVSLQQNIFRFIIGLPLKKVLNTFKGQLRRSLNSIYFLFIEVVVIIMIIIIIRGWVKSNAFFFIIGIITDAGTCVIHQNEAGPPWITSLLLNIATERNGDYVSLSKERIYPCLVKFCWLFFEPLHQCSFYFLVTGIMFLISLSPMKEGLRGNHFASDEEVKTVLMKWLKQQSTEFYEAWIHTLIRRWNIDTERSYVEKEGYDSKRTSFILMYDICFCVIIPILKKKPLLFDSPSIIIIIIIIIMMMMIMS